MDHFYQLNNVIMEDKNEEQIQECFVQQEMIQIHSEDVIDLKIQICKKINQLMPANQLRAVQRPQNMTPRTFFLERPFYLLNACLNQPCQESVTEVQGNKLKQTIVNSKNLGMEDYFKKTKFKCIYNKLETYRQERKYFSGRLKGLDSLIDYNWKHFKELQQPQSDGNQYTLQPSQDSIDSDFESGNICRAYANIEQQQQKQYYLIIENDLNTYGYNNWFFFRFKNKVEGRRRFKIVNIIKKTAFYNQGMLISIFSMQKNKHLQQKWFKGGKNITFGSINFIRDHHELQHYYSLSFQYDFDYPNDQVYFALNQPYTYSRLINFISNVKAVKESTKVQIKTLGYSISNNIIPMVRVYNDNHQTEEVILVLGRQHPCQTVGSFIAQSIIQELTHDTPICNHLLNQFQFVIIPMVNPDGVIHGTSRTNMAGLDLNRQWSDNALKELTPQTTKIKQFITNLTKTKKIKYVFDLHGHGKKLSSFFFSCKNNQNLRQNYRLLSFAMKKLQKRFSLFSCTYGIARDKETTLRSKTHSMGVRHSYTLETSHYGWKTQDNSIQHFNETDYYQIGKNLIRSIFLIESQLTVAEKELNLSKQSLITELQAIIDQVQKQQKNNDNNDNLSDSDPEGDRLDAKDLIGKCENKVIKKKLQETYASKQKIDFKRKNRFSQRGSNISRDAIRNTSNISRDSIRNTSTISRDTMRNTFIRDCITSQVNQQITINSSQNKSNISLYQFRSKKEKQSTSREVKQLIHSKKKPLINEKWKQRKKKIIFTRKITANQTFDQIDSLNLTRTKMHSRIQANSRSTKGISASLGITADHKTDRLKMNRIKTCQKFQQCGYEQHQNQGQQQIIENLQLKFKELKKESLNYLLTDSISILRIGQYQRQAVNEQLKAPKNSSLRVSSSHGQKESHMSREYHTLDRRKDIQSAFNKTTGKFKNLKHFLAKDGKNFQNRLYKQSYSVFYHFPI